jgi:integrase
VPPLLVDRLRRRGVLDRTDKAPVLVSSRGRHTPLTDERLGQLYRVARTAAAAECPSVADLTLRDLRRTARTWSEAGGATIAGAAALLAHSQETAARMARHYSVPGDEVTDAAQDALLNSISGQALAALLQGE